jgi:branched-chain amino acid transport system permease protein
MVVAPWAAFLVAMLLTAVVAAVLGYPALRLRGHYLAMATLGFGLIVYRMVLGLNVTGAADGISGVPEWKLFGVLTIANSSAVRVENYYAACAFLLIILVLMANMLRSRVGRALLAIHDHETAANATGVDTALFKLKAFVLSAMLAAFAGVMFTHYTGSIGPSETGPMKSVRYLALAAAGGISNLWSAAIVSILLIFLSLRDWFGSYDNAVFGAILIDCARGPAEIPGNANRARRVAVGAQARRCEWHFLTSRMSAAASADWRRSKT